MQRKAGLKHLASGLIPFHLFNVEASGLVMTIVPISVQLR